MFQGSYLMHFIISKVFGILCKYIYVVIVLHERLSKISDHYTIIYSNFKNIKNELYKLGVRKIDGIVLRKQDEKYIRQF